MMQRDLLESVYRAHARRVYLYALSLCRDPAKADDLTSDTFYKALLSLKGDGPSVQYWLLRVCRNLFLDELRKQARRSALPLDEERVPLDGDVLERYLRDEANRSLYRALLRLPPADRELLTMFYFLECGIAQTAALTGRTPGAVKTGLCRARTKLKKRMEEEQP